MISLKAHKYFVSKVKNVKNMLYIYIICTAWCNKFEFLLPWKGCCFKNTCIVGASYQKENRYTVNYMKNCQLEYWLLMFSISIPVYSAHEPWTFLACPVGANTIPDVTEHWALSYLILLGGLYLGLGKFPHMHALIIIQLICQRGSFAGL